MRERYINPFTAFGFKKIFGEEANIDLLIDFLNTLLPEAGPVVELTFLKSEHLSFAELIKYNACERHAYQDSVKYYRDIKNSLDTAREEGELTKAQEIARKMKAQGYPLADIAALTGLAETAITAL